MTLTRGNMRALVAMLKQACAAADACAKRFQELCEDQERRRDFIQKLTSLLKEAFGDLNPFNTDAKVRQTFFEPRNWARPLADQLELLRVYLPNSWVDPAYLEQRMTKPVPAGFTRVVVPKLSYLETILRPANLVSDQPWDIYHNIGVAIEHVCGEHEQKHGAKFKNMIKGKLGPDQVRCHEQAAKRRRQAEATVPGDIMILDVDLGNRTLGDKKKLCHTPRWSRKQIGLSGHLMHLSAVDVGYILLVNEARLTRFEDLCIDCTLEEYSEKEEDWACSLCWGYFGGQLLDNNGEDCYADPYDAAGVALRPGVAGNSDLGNLA